MNQTEAKIRIDSLIKVYGDKPMIVVGCWLFVVCLF